VEEWQTRGSQKALPFGACGFKSRPGHLLVRVASFTDARVIAEVHVASWKAAYRGIVAQELLDALSVDERERQWIEYLEGLRVLVVDDGDALAGFVAFDESTAEVKALYVAPGRFRRGIGSLLLRTAHEHLRAAGRDEVVLWVFADHAAARAFYAAHGYAPDGATATNARTGLEEIRLSRNLRDP
jgi:ribosomal protein S18 acetylase RimI-like enzyme